MIVYVCNIKTSSFFVLSTLMAFLNGHLKPRVVIQTLVAYNVYKFIYC